MKESIYNTQVNINNKTILYNTLSRKYIVYDDTDADFNYVINNINNSSYSLNQLEILKSLISKGIIIKDNADESEKIKYLEKNFIFQDKVYYLTIQPTLDCNFRCTYCYEKHEQTTIDIATEDKILKFVENITKSLSTLHVIWFGGEPMMRFDALKRLSEGMKKICYKNNCRYTSFMVSNGYLFDDKIINDLKELSVDRIQITIDGNKDSHNSQRPLLDGSETYDKVTENLVKLVENNFNITFRINVSENNYKDIDKVLEIVPKDKRNKVIISICNLFQTKEKLDLYKLYKLAIEKGYVYGNTSLSFATCSYGCKNSITIEPNGKCSICSCMSEKGLKAGYINELGNIVIEDEGTYLKMRNLLATDREMCLQCKKLPMCMGGCLYARYKNGNKSCVGKGPDGLVLEDKIKLHYLYDLVSEKKSIS